MSDPKRGIEAFERLVRGSDAVSAPRGACKKCGSVGHLTYECKNNLKLAPKPGALVKKDRFADEKARLRAEIEQLKQQRDKAARRNQSSERHHSSCRSKGRRSRRSPSPSSTSESGSESSSESGSEEDSDSASSSGRSDGSRSRKLSKRSDKGKDVKSSESSPSSSDSE
ncbi:hypothetical protein FB645_000661 [Coemansia sp. IMI 203386]|nr:hypothetical protein FB645_000661 [Coemansia sp. IMI 203386]